MTTALRADIDSLVVKNEVTLQGLRGTRDALQQQSDKVTYWDVLCANAEVAFTDRSSSVDMLRSNLSRAVVHVDHLSAKNGLWKRSIVDVEAEVAALEAAADALAKVAPAAPNVVALRAQASAVSSLTTLSQNLARQVSLLTDLRAAGGALDVELTGYLATLTQLVVEAEAMLARHQALLLSFIEILTSGNPAQAAEDYLRKEVAARVKAVLADSGLTPEAFADHLLAGRDPAVVQLLRPRMVASFSQMLPPVFSTGELG